VPPTDLVYSAPSTEPTPSNLVARPLVLLLGCDEAVLATCRSFATKARVLVRSMAMPCQRAEVLALHPLVIVLPETVYEGAPWGFEVLAEKVGAALLLLERGRTAAMFLESRMLEALMLASRVRARDADAAQS
jgi:hypothetical protein